MTKARVVSLYCPNCDEMIAYSDFDYHLKNC